MRSLAVAGLLHGAAAAAFRPPSVPLLTQSPMVNSWSSADALPGTQPTFWEGSQQNMYSAIRVDGTPYTLMGVQSPVGQLVPAQNAQQLSVTVFATQTVYALAAGPVCVNVTFTSPLLTEDWELLSRPAHYWTFDAMSCDGQQHDVQLYADINGWLVARDPTVDMSWERMIVTGPGLSSEVTALRIGATTQSPLQDTNDRPSWGYAYLLAETGSGAGSPAASMVLQGADATRTAFLSTGAIPTADNSTQPAPLIPNYEPAPASGPQTGVDRSGLDLPGYPISIASGGYGACEALCNQTSACVAWAFGIPSCGGDPAQGQCWLKGGFPSTSPNSCRVSGQKAGAPTSTGQPLVAAAAFTFSVAPGAPVSRWLTIAVDEIASISWFGEVCPPYWRRALPVGNASVVPMDMLATAFSEYHAVIQACDAFDAETARMLTAVGGAEYATIAQLTYRQVFGAMQLVWVPSKADAWYFLKEISSCGCLNTADVIYPAFPQILYYSPELMKRMVVSHLEYAMNMTSQPYPLPWAPHHLGYWPIADLPYTQQENMPLEESAWDLLIIAAIAQRQGGDLTWLAPYWPAVQTWYNFLVTLLPFPGEQLSTDDFDGQIYNASNLAAKGIASIAAYGYIVEAFTGNATAAEEAYTIAATYAQTFVQYGWHDAGADSHFQLGYTGSKGSDGNSSSYAMMYNLLWYRLLGYDNLLPNQAALMQQQQQWYSANVMQHYGLPLNSRALYTKDDWMTFTAAMYYTNDSTPQPSAFSQTLFDGLFRFANETTSREPLSDWTNTNQPTAVGFLARPVYGAMYAPVLVAQAETLGLGSTSDTTVQRARAVFERVHAQAANAAA